MDPVVEQESVQVMEEDSHADIIVDEDGSEDKKGVEQIEEAVNKVYIVRMGADVQLSTLIDRWSAVLGVPPSHVHLLHG